MAVRRSPSRAQKLRRFRTASFPVHAPSHIGRAYDIGTGADARGHIAGEAYK